MRQCPLCQAAYPPEATQVIKEWEGSQLVHMTCGGCGVAVLFLIVSTPLGMSSIGMLTDLVVADIQRLFHAPPISEEDLFAFHESIQSENAFRSLVKG